VRDVSNPIETLPGPSVFASLDSGEESTPMAEDNPFVSIEGPESEPAAAPETPAAKTPAAENSVTETPATENRITKNPVTKNPVTKNPVTNGTESSRRAAPENEASETVLGPQNRGVMLSPARTDDAGSTAATSGPVISAEPSPSLTSFGSRQMAIQEQNRIAQREAQLAPNTSRFPSVPQPSQNRFGPPPPRPHVREFSTPAPTSPVDNGARIAFGGGAVQVTAPWDWRIYEVSEGRQVRLVVSPAEIKSRNELVDGLWIVCHATRYADAQTDLRQLLASRLDAATTGTVAASAMREFRVGQADGVRQEFAVQNATGFHALLRASWGICEIHARTSNPQVSKLLLDRVLSTVEIRDVRLAHEANNSRVAASAQLIGSWKSYRSRFRLTADGRIEIEPETTAVRALGETQGESSVLRGDYESRDDLLLIRWDDGSFLNFRWRLDGDSLLLTDHDGRISELRLFLE